MSNPLPCTCHRLEHLCATCGEHTLRPHDSTDVECYRMARAKETQYVPPMLQALYLPDDSIVEGILVPAAYQYQAPFLCDVGIACNIKDEDAAVILWIMDKGDWLGECSKCLRVSAASDQNDARISLA